MQRCLSCGELVPGDILHLSCLRKLFGVNYLPVIDLSLKEISIKAQKMAGKLSISGVQPKLSIKLDKKNKKLEVAAEGGEYILKPQVQTFRNLPQNENLCMTAAAKLGIDVPPHCLIRLKDNSLAYIVKRFDRVKGKKIHQEDFFQVLGKKDKYSGSLEQIGKELGRISRFPGLDLQLFFERILFFFIIGNGDAHTKNFSISYDDEGNIRLSPAYDIVSSKLVIPGEEDLALPMNGKRNNITVRDFRKFSNYLKIPAKAYDKILSHYLEGKDMIVDAIEHSALDEEEKQGLLDIVKDRYRRLHIG
jgi:serine/threonine-protein kinase HipA